MWLEIDTKDSFTKPPTQSPFGIKSNPITVAIINHFSILSGNALINCQFIS